MPGSYKRNEGHRGQFEKRLGVIKIQILRRTFDPQEELSV